MEENFMTRKLVAIGGGENGRPLGDGEYAPYETEPMDEEIIKLTGKEKPNFLFIGHSQAPSIEIQEDYYQTMKKIYGDKFGGNCQDLKSDALGNIEKAYGLKVYWNKDEYKEEKITISYEFEDISRLFNKSIIINYEEER